MIKIWAVVISEIIIAAVLPIVLPDYDKKDFLPAVVFLSLMLFYYIAMWCIFGRDRYEIKPCLQTKAPTDIFAETCHLWQYKGYSNPADICAITLIQMIQNQFIQVKNKSGYIYQIIRTGKAPETPAEKLYAACTAATETFSWWDISAKMNRFINRNIYYQKKVYHQLYRQNERPFLVGAYLFVGLIFFLRFPFYMSVCASIVSVFWGLIIVHANIRFVFNSRFIMSIFVLTIMLMYGFISPQNGFRSIAMSCVLIGLYPLFRYLLFSPSQFGAQQLGRVQGLKLFLNKMRAPDVLALSDDEIRTLYLYAVALGREQNWQKYCLPQLPAEARESIIYKGDFIVGFHMGYNDYKKLGGISTKIVKLMSKMKRFGGR